MAFQILLNLMIAFLWMFLNNDWTASGFIVGYVLGWPYWWSCGASSTDGCTWAKYGRF